MPELFTNAKLSILHRFDVKSKMVFALLCSLVALFLTRPLPLLTLFVVTLIYALCMRRYKVLLVSYLFFIGVMLLSVFCVSLLVSFYPQFKDSARIDSLAMPFLRGASVMNAVMPMALTIRVQSLLTTLQNLHLPFVIYLPGAVMIRFVPSFIHDIKQVFEAMKIRGFEVNVKNVLTHPVLLTRLCFTPLVFMSLRTSEDLGVAAELKGIGSGNLCTYKRMRLKKRDIALIVFSVILIGTCLVFEYISGGSFYGSMHG